MQTYRVPAPIQSLPEKPKVSLKHRLLHVVRFGNWVPMGVKNGQLFLTCHVCGVKVKTIRRKTSWQWGDIVFSEIECW